MVTVSRRRALALAFLTLWFTGSLVSHAGACSCGPPGPPKVEMRKAHAVFEGVVIGVKSSHDREDFRFRVLRAWKGVSQPEVVVTSVGLLCGIAVPPREGEKWLVFAGAFGSGLLTSQCSLTGRSETRVAELKGLGTPSWRASDRGSLGASPQNNALQRTKPAQAMELRR